MGTLDPNRRSTSLPQPVLHLDCLNYNQGDEEWIDTSGNDYHFRAYASANSAPIKNEDGTLQWGMGRSAEDEATTRRYF